MGDFEGSFDIKQNHSLKMHSKSFKAFLPHREGEGGGRTSGLMKSTTGCPKKIGLLSSFEFLN